MTSAYEEKVRRTAAAVEAAYRLSGPEAALKVFGAIRRRPSIVCPVCDGGYQLCSQHAARVGMVYMLPDINGIEHQFYSCDLCNGVAKLFRYAPYVPPRKRG